MKALRLAIVLAMLTGRTLAGPAILSAPEAAAQSAAQTALQPATQPLQAVVADWKASLHFDSLSGIGQILRGPDLVRFKLDEGSFLLGGTSLRRLQPIRRAGDGLEIERSTRLALEEWFALREAERASRAQVAVILIDPGHGGRDPGAVGEHGSGANRLRILEKDITLAIALDLYEALSRLWPEKTILITRNDDSFPSLDQRVSMANGYDLNVNEAVIYISIHANASFNVRASGFEVWYLNPEYRRTVVDGKKAEGIDAEILPIINTMLEEEYTTESIFLARSILEGLDAKVGEVSPSRGIRAEEWFVVRNARMPSVLVEVGFVTNEAEARLLATEAYLQKLSKGIYNGVVNFVEYFERRRGQSQP